MRVGHIRNRHEARHGVLVSPEVDVRRVSESSAADVQSLVTRMETALADHDVEVAYKAWTELPSFAKDVAQSRAQ